MPEQSHLLAQAARWDRLKPILGRAMVSTDAFGRVFMPERFSRPTNSLDQEFFRALDDDSHQFTIITAPRGLGKTTRGTIGLPARSICYRKVKFVLVVSCTNDVASGNVLNLSRELSGNSRIKDVFGDLRGEVWAANTGNIETKTGIRVFARGAGQQVRGLLHQDRRPDLVIVDDLESAEAFRLGDPTAYINNLTEWFFADLVNSIDKKRTRVVYLATILHAKALASTLLRDKHWNPVRLELCDDDYHSNFPDFMTDEEVMKLAEGYARRGMLDVFYREYRNLPMSKQDAIFRQDMFKYWSVEELEGRHIDKWVIVDPAKTTKTHSDPTAITCWGFDTGKNRIYQLDTVNARLHPEEIYSEAHAMALRNKTFNIAVEETGVHEFASYPFDQFLRSKGFPPIIKLSAKGKKRDRIAQLAPFYAMGVIFHHPDRRINGPLESQLLTFPSGHYDDVADCSAYMLELFHLESRFFTLAEQDDEKALAEELALMKSMDEAEDYVPENWRMAP